jgi:chromosome segregation ATPase
MTTATENDLTTLRERRRQLSDRLEDIRSEQRDIVEDLATARTDWADCIEIGENADLLAERVHMRERELADRGHAAEHLGRLLADLDTQVADIEARAQLADDVAAYAVALESYAATLPDLPSALPDAAEVVSAALGALLGEFDGARTSHDQLSGTAAALQQRAGMLGVEIHAPQPPDWSTGLNGIDKDGLYRQLALAVMQRRGADAVMGEIVRVITLNRNSQRKAAR